MTSGKGYKRSPEQKVRRLEVARRQQPPCRFPTRSGAPCRSFAMGPDEGCFTHTQDAAIMAKRRAASMKGSRSSNLTRASKLLLSGPFGPLVELLIEQMLENHAGSLDPNRLNASAMAMRAIVSAKDYDLAARIVGRLERQVEAMESGDEQRPAEVWVGRDGRVEVSDGEGGYRELDGDVPLLTTDEEPS